MKSSLTKITAASFIVILLATLTFLVGIVLLENYDDDVMSEYTAHYHEALETFPGSAAGIESGLDAFKKAYANLAEPATADKMHKMYAEELYFNDTVKTIRNRQELTDYMNKTSKRLKTSVVNVDQVIRDDADVFVRWTMHFVSSAYGIEVDSKTIGMTHLRFNQEGQIILHQDFWDSAAGIYEHLPLVGFFVRRAQSAMN